jgi:signal transduction histidine kinase
MMLIQLKEIRLFFLKHGYLLISAAWLITLAFLANNYWLYYSSPKGVQHSLQQNLQQREKSFDQFVSDSARMQKFLQREYTQEDLDQLTGQGQDFYLFFYQGDWETFWTTDQISFGPEITQLPEGASFRKLQSGYYEIIRKNLAGNPQGRNFVLGFIPVKEEYYFTNPYLPNRYYQLPRISNQYVINQQGLGLPIYSAHGALLFSIQYIANPGGNTPGWLSGILFALAVVCVLVFINLFAVFLGEKKGRGWGFLFLCGFILLVRYLSYIFPFPFSYSHYQLFDATVYASNLVLRSLGDLLIDVALAAWIILYARTQLEERLRLPKMSQGQRYGAMFGLGIGAYYACLLVAEIIRGLVINSKISFDVTDFFSLSIYSIVGFCILGLLACCFFFLSQIINRLLDQLSEYQYNLKYTIFGITGIIWLILQMLQATQDYTVGLMIWAIFYFYMLDVSRHKLGKDLNLAQVVIWLVLITASVTALLVHYNTQREMAGRQQLAIKLSKQKDPTLEFNLGMLDSAIVRDSQVIGYYRNPEPDAGQFLLRHLLNGYFANLKNRYDLSFYLYDNAGSIVGSRDTVDRKAVIDRMLRYNSEPTGVNDLFYHEVTFTEFSYISRLQVIDPVRDSTLGYLYYQLKPKTIKQETLYPKLLMRSEDNQFENKLNKYSYAVYDHLHLVYNRNDYPFALHLSMKSVPLNDFGYSTDGSYSLLWYKPTKDKLVVVARHGRVFIEAITLFAYMFCIFLVLLLAFRLFRFLIKARMRPHVLRDIFNLTMRTRVHAIIIFIVVFVFIILGVSTISFFIRRYDSQHREELGNGMKILLGSVEEAFQQNNTPEGSFGQASFPLSLTNNVQAIADSHGVDINIYDLDGNLRVSTQNLIYENGLLSSKIDPNAYYKLYYLHQVQVIQKEQVGNLSFLSSYASIRNRQGQTVAFLNQPYFASQVDLKQEISNFLVTLINLNAFIFLLSGLLALLLTNSITRSFTLIREKLRQVNLSGTNEEIAWNREDEIGELVAEYNKMVQKLEVSAAALAKSEREGAWREMARQVAHEIKNPLTPMKLSLQHLQRAIEHDSPRAHQLARDVAGTLIEQIEHLAQIASDFSAFANITYANYEKVLLNEVLHSVTSLHNGYEKVDILYDRPDEPLFIYADKTQMNRLFTNLVQNAMQAVPEGREGMVLIRTFHKDSTVTVQVKDNGMGIPEEARPRIFTPNFTTKSSGTGLGLAMCKNIMEQIHGKIWFDTEEGKGTSFFVEFPRVPPPEEELKPSEKNLHES